MGLFSRFMKENKFITKYEVEVFKGILTAQAVVEFCKKEFAESESVKEVAILGNLTAENQFLKLMMDKHFFSAQVSEDFTPTYLVCINDQNKVAKIKLAVSESIDDKLNNLFAKNNQIIRISQDNMQPKEPQGVESQPTEPQPEEENKDCKE